MNKAEARLIFKKKRLALEKQDVEQQSEAIAECFFNHINLEAYKVLHSFLPIAKWNEVDTFPLLEKIWLRFPAIITVVPIVKPNEPEMIASRLFPHQKLSESQWSIPEPRDIKEIIDPKTIDIMLIPLLTCDLNGHRVGYGKGFYDRYLKNCKPEMLKIGLNFFPPIPKIEDINLLDIPIDCLITPKEIYDFRAKE